MSFAAAYSRHAVLWPLVCARLPAGELAHDAEHLTRVYRWSMNLADEAGADRELAGATALVHDFVFVPKDDAARAQGGERSAAAAPAVLKQSGYAEAEILQIAAAVRTSSWSRGLAPTNALGVVLQDADRLDAIGALGILRTVACGQFMALNVGRDALAARFYDPADPLCGSGRTLNDRRQCIDHFLAKLLSLSAGMRLPTAQAEAARRHATMQVFLADLAGEIGSAAPGTVAIHTH